MNVRQLSAEIRNIEADLAKYGGKKDVGSGIWRKILEARLEELKRELLREMTGGAAT